MSQFDQQALSTGKQEAHSNGYKFLTNEHIAMIDEALQALGSFGEVRLVVEKGRLRFIVTQKSYDALKWRPGEIRISQ